MENPSSKFYLNPDGRLTAKGLHEKVYVTGIDKKTIDNKGEPLKPTNPEDSVIFCVNTDLIFGE